MIVYSFCMVLKDIGLEAKLYPPRCHMYLLNIHYCCSLTEAESVTKDCASRRNHLQSGKASLRKCVSIQQHILVLPEMVFNLFLQIFKFLFDTHILIDVIIFFLLLLLLNNIFLLDIRAM